MTLVITAVMPLLIFATYMEARFMEGFANEVGPFARLTLDCLHSG